MQFLGSNYHGGVPRFILEPEDEISVKIYYLMLSGWRDDPSNVIDESLALKEATRGLTVAETEILDELVELQATVLREDKAEVGAVGV